MYFHLPGGQEDANNVCAEDLHITNDFMVEKSYDAVYPTYRVDQLCWSREAD